MVKLNITLLLTVAVTAVSARDTFEVVNTKDDSGNWHAIASWNRHNGQPARATSARDECIYAPYTPWPEVNTLCFDWYRNRGHFYLNGVSRKYCFRKVTGDYELAPGRSYSSVWRGEDNELCPIAGV